MCQCPPCVLLPAQLPPWDADCLDELWKVGRADKILLWNKCSRVQGLQLEKASGEAALGEVFLWFQWEGAAEQGVFKVWSGETWAQNRGWGEAWPQSCHSFSENKNWESLKTHTQTELEGGWSCEAFLVPSSHWLQNISGNSSLGEAHEDKCSRVSVGRDQWASMGCSGRMMMKTKENVPVFHFRAGFLYSWLCWLWLDPDLK